MADVEYTRRERQGRADQGRVGQRRDTSFLLLYKILRGSIRDGSMTILNICQRIKEARSKGGEEM